MTFDRQKSFLIDDATFEMTYFCKNDGQSPGVIVEKAFYRARNFPNMEFRSELLKSIPEAVMADPSEIPKTSTGKAINIVTR